jgi:peptidyl-prolyl cis-trans isomerase SurA
MNSTRALWVAMLCAGAAATAAVAQQPASSPAAQKPNARSVTLPENVEVFGTAMPSVIKATAIVNGEVITQTDVDQRLALLAISQGTPIPADEVERLRQQILRNLIDETLEIHAAKAEKIEVKGSDIDRTIQRVASGVKMTPEQFGTLLTNGGSSMRSIRRQIEGEIAWQRLQQRKIEVTVGEDEVKAVIDKMNASKGEQQYRVGEIFLPSPPGEEAQTIANANQILEQLKGGASFAGYARQYSQSSSAAVGGDLGWMRPEQLPDAIATVLRTMGPGTISNPIPNSGGVSIIAVQDTRRILTHDPRDDVLNLKQVSIAFPKGISRAQAEPIVSRFAEASRNIGGCGGAEKIAADFNAEVLQNDNVKMRDLPNILQDMMVSMQVGQATQPVGNMQDGIRIFVLCGRDQVDPTQPSYDEVYNQLNDERINTRARRLLRDLRRDAVIEFR